MDRKFNEYSKFNLSDINKEILKKWDEENVFESSIKEREGAPSFVFFEGPPSANGMPGIHHVMARTIKDIICRFKTMKGFQVPAGTLTVSRWSWVWRKLLVLQKRISAPKFRSMTTMLHAARR